MSSSIPGCFIAPESKWRGKQLERFTTALNQTSNSSFPAFAVSSAGYFQRSSKTFSKLQGFSCAVYNFWEGPLTRSDLSARPSPDSRHCRHSASREQHCIGAILHELRLRVCTNQRSHPSASSDAALLGSRFIPASFLEYPDVFCAVSILGLQQKCLLILQCFRGIVARRQMKDAPLQHTCQTVVSCTVTKRHSWTAWCAWVCAHTFANMPVLTLPAYLISAHQ